MANNEECPEPQNLWEHAKHFVRQVLNHVAVRTATLIATGVIVGLGWVNHAVTWLIQMFTQVIVNMPPVANLPVPY